VFGLPRTIPVVVALGLLTVSACAPSTFYKSETLVHPDDSTDIVVLAPDIELSELRASGLSEPNAQWTNQARKQAAAALKEKIEEIGANTHLVEFSLDELDREDPVVRLAKLHGVVGSAVAMHYFNPDFKLPHKGGKFNWTLGKEANVIGERYDADYALFLFVRDSYTSAGRAAVIVIAAIFGVSVQGGQQVGYASFVDLKSGDIVWFNRLIRGHGDLRNLEGARETVDALLKDFPK